MITNRIQEILASAIFIYENEPLYTNPTLTLDEAKYLLNVVEFKTKNNDLGAIYYQGGKWSVEMANADTRSIECLYFDNNDELVKWLEDNLV